MESVSPVTLVQRKSSVTGESLSACRVLSPRGHPLVCAGFLLGVGLRRQRRAGTWTDLIYLFLFICDRGVYFISFSSFGAPAHPITEPRFRPLCHRPQGHLPASPVLSLQTISIPIRKHLILLIQLSPSCFLYVRRVLSPNNRRPGLEVLAPRRQQG